MKTRSQERMRSSRKTWKKTGYKLVFDKIDAKSVKTVDIGWYLLGFMVLATLLIFALK